MPETLTLGSLFDGSGGFPLGGIINGIRPLWASEIEPFPVMVTTKRLPFMEHIGDISTVRGGEIAPVDIITFGSPCQDMSIAGRRDGLSGSRSGLFYQAVRIIKEMREATDGRYPRYIVWENVTGAFSSNKGEDFRAVLEEIVRIKEAEADIPRYEKWPSAGQIMADHISVAWRVFDAQYWGVPQRRKRIYLVADLDGGRAGSILFESEGLSGYSAEGFRAWQRAAGSTEGGAHETGCICLNDQGGQRMDVTEDCTSTLRAQANHPPCVLFDNHGQDCRFTGPVDKAQTVVASYGTGGNNQSLVVETPKTLKIRCGKEGGGKGPLIQDDLSATLATNNDQTLFQPMAFGICSKDSNAMKSANPHSGFYEAETSRTLDCNGGNPSCNQGGIAVVEGNGSRPSHRGDGYKDSDVMYTLNTVEQHAVAYGIDRAAYNQGKNAQFGFTVRKEVEPTMVAKGPGAVCQPTYSSSKASFFTDAAEEVANTLVATDYKDPPLVNQPEYIVRRLTPTECARLQGFPDWWTDGLGTDDPSEEDVSRWAEVFETYRRATGSTSKPKTESQIRRWLKDPYSDSAAYKRWGNGVALPCVCFVLAGIVWADQKCTRPGP